MALFDLSGKIVLVTGAGSGIGKAIAGVFASRGALLHLIDLDPDSGTAGAREIRDLGGLAHSHACDVSSQEKVQALITRILEEQGRVDILVNSAGIAQIGNLEQATETDMDRVFAVNVKGTYHMMHAVVGPMKSQGGGVILNLASIVASVGIPDRFAYTMSKGAVLGMTLSVAKDYIGEGIRCNCISPARVHTPFVDGYLSRNYPGREEEMFRKLSRTQPIGRMARPEEIAWLALYLCSDEASFITGCDYPIDGGFIRLNN